MRELMDRFIELLVTSEIGVSVRRALGLCIHDEAALCIENRPRELYLRCCRCGLRSPGVRV